MGISVSSTAAVVIVLAYPSARRDMNPGAGLRGAPPGHACAMPTNTDDLKGRVKEAAGDLKDDDKLKREGKADRATGKAKETVDKAADRVKEALDR